MALFTPLGGYFPINLASSSSVTGILSAAHGGTGVNNGSLTLTLSGGTSGYVFTSDSSGNGTWQANAALGGVTSIAGTSNEITASASTGAVTLSIASGYIGQTSITTLGTITTGTWNGLAIPTTHGGTALTSFTNSGVFYASSSSVMGQLSVVDNGVLISNNSGVPSFLTNGTAGYVLTANSGAPPSWQVISGTVSSVTGTTAQIDVSPTTGACVVSIDPAYIGQTSITTLGTISSGTWHGGIIGSTYGGTGINNGSLTITLGSGSSGYVLTSDSSGNATWQANAALGGVTSIAGTSNQITASASTGAVTLSIASGYVGQTSITTLGTIGTGTWAGTTIGLAHGGTAAALTANDGGIVYSGASALAILAGTATANQMLMSGSNTAPTWSTATYPATTTANQILYSSSANQIGGIGVVDNGVLVSSSGGVPSFLANGTLGYVLATNSAAPPSWQSIASLGGLITVDGDSGSAAPSSGVLTISGGSTGLTTSGTSATISFAGRLGVGYGGTNATSFTAYAPICGGTTSTGALQSIASVGTTGQFLGSNGSGALPTMQAVSGRLLSTQVLLPVATGATYTPTSTLVNNIYVVAQGPGGGGGSSGVSGVLGSGVSGGGGAGAYLEKYIKNIGPTYTATYTIPAGGAGGAAGATAAAGTAGAATTWSDGTVSLSAGGGAGGSIGANSTTTGAAISVGPSGASSATGGDLNIAGTGGGGGWGIVGTICVSGAGAGTPFCGDSWQAIAITGQSNGGDNGIAHTGTGGSGSANAAASTNSAAGGNGGSGLIIVYEYA